MSGLSATNEIGLAGHVAMKNKSWNELPVQKKLFTTICTLEEKLVILTPKISRNASAHAPVSMGEEVGHDCAHLQKMVSARKEAVM